MVDTQVGEIVTFQQIQFDLINDIADFAIPEDVYVISDPLWKSNVVGYFIGDAPHVGSIIPGAKEKIDVQFISKTSFLFRTESEALRLKVLRRKYWRIADIPLVVNVWTPETAAPPRISLQCPYGLTCLMFQVIYSSVEGSNASLYQLEKMY